MGQKMNTLNSYFRFMVSVAQLVELRIVVPAVVGSSPIVHPIFVVSGPLAQLVEQLTLNQRVGRSSRPRPTNKSRREPLCGFFARSHV